MKENRKLLKEVLKDIRHDMSDEEVLNLLADSKISVNPSAESTPSASGQRTPLPDLRGAGRLFFPLPGFWYCG